MKYLKQFGIILAISFIGEILNAVIPLPIPTSIYGLIIMFICLETGIVRIGMVKETGKFLLEIMPLMFIPAAVGLLESWSVLRPVCISVITITIVSTIVVMVVTGRITQGIIRLEQKKDKKVPENE